MYAFLSGHKGDTWGTVGLETCLSFLSLIERTLMGVSTTLSGHTKTGDKYIDPTYLFPLVKKSKSYMLSLD